MNKVRLLAGVGAMTPAFILDVTARAAIEPARPSVATAALDQELLKRSLLALSPAEKLRAAGDRIRLCAETLKPPKNSGTRPPRGPCSDRDSGCSAATALRMTNNPAGNGPKGGGPAIPSGTQRAR
jgi:hypothetical protein